MGGPQSVHRILPPVEKAMDLQQLKLLAGSIRAFLQQANIRIGHNESLDIAAALPGLRNWPEVSAFPDRVSAFALDMASASRLAIRLKKRYGFDMTPSTILGKLQATAATPIRNFVLKEADLELFEKWETRLHAIFGATIPATYSWSNTDDITRTLQVLSGTTAIHVFFPGGGGQDLGWAGRSAESGALELVPELLSRDEHPRRRAYIVNPETLNFRLPGGNVLESHFVLTTRSLKPTGRNTMRSSGLAEEVVNLGNGQYVERRYWDEGRLEDGEELPDDARIEIRYVQPGRFVVFSKVALYNRLRGERFDAYTGVHQDAVTFDAIVDKLASIERTTEI